MNGHNHPARCCCSLSDDPIGVRPVCPVCVEHGELAQLGKHTIERVAELLDVPPGLLVRTDLEYACCHQLVGRPHTDYCQAHGYDGAPCAGTAPAPPNTADAPPPPTTGETATPAPDAAATASPATASPAPDEPHA